MDKSLTIRRLIIYRVDYVSGFEWDENSNATIPGKIREKVLITCYTKEQAELAVLQLCPSAKEIKVSVVLPLSGEVK